MILNLKTHKLIFKLIKLIGLLLLTFCLVNCKDTSTGYEAEGVFGPPDPIPTKSSDFDCIVESQCETRADKISLQLQETSIEIPDVGQEKIDVAGWCDLGGHPLNTIQVFFESDKIAEFSESPYKCDSNGMFRFQIVHNVPPGGQVEFVIILIAKDYDGNEYTNPSNQHIKKLFVSTY